MSLDGRGMFRFLRLNQAVYKFRLQARVKISNHAGRTTLYTNGTRWAMLSEVASTHRLKVYGTKKARDHDMNRQQL
jgi:propanediol dehydratase small subunit